jgi:hypothetical protein
MSFSLSGGIPNNWIRRWVRVSPDAVRTSSSYSCRPKRTVRVSANRNESAVVPSAKGRRFLMALRQMGQVASRLCTSAQRQQWVATQWSVRGDHQPGANVEEGCRRSICGEEPDLGIPQQRRSSFTLTLTTLV